MDASRRAEGRGKDQAEGAGGLRARRRRRRRAREVDIAMNLAPMIDVTFLLLIFFLVTTTFERAEGVLASNVPRTSSSQTVALPISPIVVRVNQTGPNHEDFSIRVDKLQNQPATFDALTNLLRELQQRPGFDTQTPVIIVAADDLRWDHVVGGWNAALRAGCERIAFADP